MFNLSQDPRPHFKAFNRVRRTAQQIKHPGFQREYFAAIEPVLEAVRHTKGTYDPVFQVEEALKTIHQLAKHYQHNPNTARALRPPKPQHGPQDFALLLEVEQLTDHLLGKASPLKAYARSKPCKA
jgi:hypothetical protein